MKHNKAGAVIIGGGAAGLAAAIEFARCARSLGLKCPITVLEGCPKAGKKLLATGNGKCNLGNSDLSPENYGGDLNFAEYALKSFGTDSTLRFFRSMGVLCRADDCGRIYPMSAQAATVSDALRREAQRLGIEIITDKKISNIKKSGELFYADDISAECVILACGGKAARIHGSDGSGYALAKSLGHSVTELFPSLVPLTAEGKFWKSLKGVRSPAAVSLLCGGRVFEGETGEIQLTDYGVSGIAVMQLSGLAARFLSEGKKPIIKADLIPDLKKDELCSFLFESQKNLPSSLCGEILAGVMHKALARVMLKDFAKIPPETAIGSLSRRDIIKISDTVKNAEFAINGTKGFDSAQVTAGGLVCGEFDEETMMSRLCPNLFAAGEILDVDGKCGGYNLQWAWASGRLAGRSAAERMAKL